MMTLETIDLSLEAKVRKCVMKHEGGTKGYKLTMISHPDSERAFIVRWWGKVGQWGQIQVDAFNSRLQARQEFEKILTQKQSRGYSIHAPDSYIKKMALEDLPRRYTADIKKIFGQKWVFFAADIKDAMTPIEASVKETVARAVESLEESAESLEGWGTW